MATWMTLDGVNCEDVGLHVLEYPARCVPRRRYTKKKIPGGKEIIIYDGVQGYENMLLTAQIYFDGQTDADRAIAFLLPESREIIFGDQPEYCYQGMVDEQIDFDRIFRERKPCRFKVNFLCSPYRQLSAPGEGIVVTEAGVIVHPGSARSHPLIRAYGSGDGAIVLRGQETIRLTGLKEDEALVIDSGAMICTDEAYSMDKSRQMTGDYPYLEPGENAIVTSGGVTRIEIEPRFAWLGR